MQPRVPSREEQTLKTHHDQSALRVSNIELLFLLFGKKSLRRSKVIQVEFELSHCPAVPYIHTTGTEKLDRYSAERRVFGDPPASARVVSYWLRDAGRGVSFGGYFVLKRWSVDLEKPVFSAKSRRLSPFHSGLLSILTIRSRNTSSVGSSVRTNFLFSRLYQIVSSPSGL